MKVSVEGNQYVDFHGDGDTYLFDIPLEEFEREFTSWLHSQYGMDFEYCPSYALMGGNLRICLVVKG